MVDGEPCNTRLAESKWRSNALFTFYTPQYTKLADCTVWDIKLETSVRSPSSEDTKVIFLTVVIIRDQCKSGWVRRGGMWVQPNIVPTERLEYV